MNDTEAQVSRRYGSHDDYVRELFGAAGAESAPEGARTRALARVLLELASPEAPAPPAPRSRARFVAVGLTVVAGAAMAAGVLFFEQNAAVERKARRDQAEAELATHQAKVDALLHGLTEQQKDLERLLEEVAEAKDDAARASALARLEEAKRRVAAKTSSRPAALSGSTPSAADARAATACKCTPGDPLCSCIP